MGPTTWVQFGGESGPGPVLSRAGPDRTSDGFARQAGRHGRAGVRDDVSDPHWQAEAWRHSPVHVPPFKAWETRVVRRHAM